MASITPMGDALRQVDRLFRDGALAGLPDGRLVERFLAGGDDAFEALVARHGPMVLRSALDLLRDPIDAEDAFQLTFLTLARRAGSIRGESVGGWLRRVARRTALRLNVREACRRREDRAATPTRAAMSLDAPDGPERDELRRAIRDELDRLPERHRRPVVLCWMEGMTQTKAAARLGLSEGAVRGRLARARVLLRDRLTRRGLAPSILPALVGAAVPSAWAEAAVVAARAARSGRGPAIGRVAAIRRAIAVMVAGGSVLVAAALASDPSQAPPVRPSPKSPASAPIPVPRLVGLQKVAVRGRVLGPGGRPVAGARIYLIPDIRFDPAFVATSDPVGAFWFEQPEEAFRPDPHNGIPPSMPALLVATAEGFGADFCAVGVAVAGGRVSEMDPAYDRDFHLPDDRPIEGRVVDLRGRPVAGARVDVTQISLPPDHRWGPLLDDLRAFKNILYPTNRNWSTIVNSSSAPFVSPAETDAQGRFRIAGVGRDRLVGLRVRGPGATPTDIAVVTRDDVDDLARAMRAKFPPMRPAGDLNPRGKADPGVLLFGPKPVVEVDPARTFAGRVVADDTGEPVRGVDLFVAVLNTAGGRNYETDHPASGSDGRYRGLLSDGSPTIWITAVPDTRGDLLPATRRFDGLGAPGEVTADFRLARGVFVTGRVTEAGTGRPMVASPHDDCHDSGLLRAGFVHYVPLANNASLKATPTGLYFAGDPERAPVSTSAMIGGDGAFRILVASGPGVLLVQAMPGTSMIASMIGSLAESDAGRPTLRLYPYPRLRARSPGDGAPASADPASLPGLDRPIPLATYHAYRVIDPPAGTREMAVGVTLNRGPARPVRFVDPRGEPVRGPTVIGLLPLAHPAVTLSGSEGEASALEPDRDRPLSAVSGDGRYFAKATLRGDAATPVTVTMEPTGVLSGRLVDPEGRPLAQYTISLAYDDSFPGALQRTIAPPPSTDADGRFRIAGLIPGFRASLTFIEPPAPGTSRRPAIYRPAPLRDVVARPGGVLDLSTIRANPDR